MQPNSKNLVEELFENGKIEIENVTPVSCILGTTCTSYDLEDMEEYEEIIGEEVTLGEFLKAIEQQNTQENEE